MASTLEILRAEIQAQLAEEARPPFDNVDAIRTFITTEKPASTDNITVDLCFLGLKEYDHFWHAELINRADEDVFAEVSTMINNVDPARRSKCLFVLTIWKNRDATQNVLNFRVGFSYRFEKVHSLKLVYGNPVGSIQLRERLQAVPLPPPGLDPVNESEQASTMQPAASTLGASGAGTPSLAPDQEADMTVESSPLHAADAPIAAPLPDATPSKRRARRDDGKDTAKSTNVEAAPDGPSKKMRKSCTKELVFSSPTKKAARG